jgi:hypothetical protein
MIMIVYAHSVHGELLEELTACGVKYHTCIHDATGVGGRGPHMGDKIWPSTNNILYIAATTEGLAKKILTAIKDVKSRFREEGIQAWIWKVDEEL